MVVLRGAETTLLDVQEAKVTVFGCGIEASATEAKGTVLFTDLSYAKHRILCRALLNFTLQELR